MKIFKKAFTLAEVLITIGIVGVVAALTIPGLINTISAKAKEAQKETIEKRLIQGFNQLNTLEDGFSAHYETTEEFVKALSKYYKINSICGADNLGDCWPYSTVNILDAQTDVITPTEVSKDSVKLPTDGDYLPPASFINAQGTPFIISIKDGCALDTGRGMRELNDSGCIALMYDINGTRMPNRINSSTAYSDTDIYTTGGMSFIVAEAGGGGAQATRPIPVVKDSSLGVNIISEAFVPDPITEVDELGTNEKMTCEKALAINYEGADTTTVSACYKNGDGSNDYWLGAMYTCYKMGGHLATESDLAKMANALYYDPNTNSSHNMRSSRIPDVLSGLGSSWIWSWSSNVGNGSNPFFRSFSDSETYMDDHYSRSEGRVRAVCVAN